MRDGGQVYFTSVAFRLLYDCHASPSHFLVHLCCVAELGIAMRQHLLMLLWLLGSLFRDQDIYRDLFDYLGLPQVSIFIKSLYFPHFRQYEHVIQIVSGSTRPDFYWT